MYLPEGEWYRFSSNKIYEGKQEVIVEADLNNLPVFVKGGAVIPMQSVIQSTNEMPSDTLVIHIYNGKTLNTFSYYEDDGKSYDYENGKFYKRDFNFYGDKQSLVIDAAEGAFNSKFQYYQLALHGFEGINNFSVGGEIKTINRNSEGNYQITVNALNTRIELKWTITKPR